MLTKHRPSPALLLALVLVSPQGYFAGFVEERGARHQLFSDFDVNVYGNSNGEGSKAQSARFLRRLPSVLTSWHAEQNPAWLSGRPSGPLRSALQMAFRMGDSQLIQQHANQLPMAAVAKGDTEADGGSETGDTALPRPHASGPPDIVAFGVFIRQFYFADPIAGTCALDVVLTTEWNDTRAVSLVPSHMDNFTVDNNIPPSELWQPHLVFTSRAMQGIEEISKWISVKKTGMVTITQRLLLINKNSYSLSAYPFDSQTLTLIVASETLMLEECQLVNTGTSYAKGVRDMAFANSPFVLQMHTQFPFVDISGALRKSRGRMEMIVKRKPAAILARILKPQLIFTIVAWTAFFLPLAQYAVMPRVATCLIAFLALMTAQNAAAAQMPPMADTSWTGMVAGSFLYLVMSTVALNIMLMMVAFIFNMDELAHRFNVEVRFLYGSMVVVILVIASVASDKKQFDFWSHLSNGFICGCNIVFAIWVYIRCRNEIPK